MPKAAKSISVSDDDFEDDGYLPPCDIELQICNGRDLFELDLVALYFTDEVVKRLVEATSDHAEANKNCLQEVCIIANNW